MSAPPGDINPPATPPPSDAAAGPPPGTRRQFLERRTYRRYRLEDAARLVPVLGVFLVFGPVVILTSDTGVNGSTRGWMVYFLVVWLGLIVVAGALGRALSHLSPDQPPDRKGG